MKADFSPAKPPGLFQNGFGRISRLAWALALLVLAGTIATGTLYLRRHLREHLVRRDGEILTAVAVARQNATFATSVDTLATPASQLALALEISQIKEGVLGVRLFSKAGEFQTAFPPTLKPGTISGRDLSALASGQPVSRFRRSAELGDFFLVAGPTGKGPSPILEVSIPLQVGTDKWFGGAAQLLLDGRDLAREYATVDEHLWPLAAGLFLAAAGSLSVVLLWAFRALRSAHATVAERTARLLRANHELALAAKTRSLGSVTAHLVHGLSNPLANLQSFVAAHRGKEGANGDLTLLADSTQRMQQLVQDVVRVLGEESGGERYQLTLQDVAQELNSRVAMSVRATGVNLLTILDVETTIPNCDANLVLLILENLVQNALRFTPRGNFVRLRFVPNPAGVSCLVEDQGSGIAPHVSDHLFTPCRSTHGGSGLGLAISKQLANQLGAELELRQNSASGCVFALHLPAKILQDGAIANYSDN